MQKNNLLEIIKDPFLFKLDLLEIQNLSLKFNKFKKKKLNFKKKISLAISSDYTTTYLTELLPLFFASHGIDSNVYESEFGSLKFLSRDLNNNFWNNKVDIFLLMPSSKNLKYLPKLSEIPKTIKKNAKREADFWINIWKSLIF